MARGAFCALLCALFLSFAHAANSECTRSKAPEEVVDNWASLDSLDATCGSYDTGNLGYCEADGICGQCCSACVDECRDVATGVDCCEPPPSTPTTTPAQSECAVGYWGTATGNMSSMPGKFDFAGWQYRI